MGSLDRPGPDLDAVGVETLDAELLDAEARADDVDDGVLSADLVEVYVFDGAAVRCGLDLGDPPVDRHAARAHLVGQ